MPIIAIALAILFWRHWRSASPPSRRAMRPLALAFPLLLAVLAPIYVAYELGLDAIVEIVLNPWVWVIDFVLPVAFFTGALRLRLARGSVATAMLELGALPTPARLQEMLRRRLGDSSIVVLRWSEAQRAYVDADGRIVDEPPSGTSQALTALERDGHPIGAVLHDSALLDDPAVGNTIRHAASLVMDATEVRDQLHARGGQTDGLPSGEVTFLFADVEQSTALLESLGSTYGTVMDELRRIASEAAERNGGQLVDARGDEVFLAFPSAEGGVKTALEITNRLDRAAWPQGVVLRVRIGLHTGRPELTRSGYVGIDVHRAARIMATAGGGQIVASAAVMAKMPATDGLNVRPLGHYELRGIAERVEIVTIEDAGPLGPAAR